MKKKDILCDTGAFISLTSSCLSEILYFFVEKHNVRFIIPPAVEDEAVLYPIGQGIKKYLFSAIKIKDALNDGVITRLEKEKAIPEAETIMKLANNLFYMHGKPITLIQRGESETLALALELEVKNLLIDERTTRMLIEAPFRLKEHLEEEFRVNVMVNRHNIAELSKRIGDMNVIRSSELITIAYEYGFFDRYQGIEKTAFEAALYKIKFSGCSISFDEINECLNQVK
ncbi:hypothetical protein H0O02_01920 [Candidatus Micrarchaeota archaeon]|nr:hypothetical protein [Candidatus Micrarchaeota archaeon]